MKITGWIVILMYTIATINAGFLIGSTLLSNSSNGVAWTDIVAAFGTIIGAFATTITAYFAYKALRNWEAQFKYSQRYEALIELEKAYYELLKDFDEYNRSKFWGKRIEEGAIMNSESTKLANNIEFYKNTWECSLDSSKTALEWASTFCTPKESEGIKDIINLTDQIMRLIISPMKVEDVELNKNDLKTYSNNVKKDLCIIRNEYKN